MAQLATVFALAVPVAGFMVRWQEIETWDAGPAFPAAFAATPAELVWLGMTVVFAPFAVVALFGGGFYLLQMSDSGETEPAPTEIDGDNGSEPAEEKQAAWRRVLVAGFGVAMLVYALYVLLADTPLPLLFAGVAQLAVMGLWLWQFPPASFRVLSRTSQLVRIVPLGLAIVAIYIPASVATGPSRTGQFVAQFTFTDNTPTDGAYAWVGESGGLAWLLPCAKDSKLVMIDSGRIVEATAVHAEAQGGTSPTLLDVINGKADFEIDIRPC